ncbi:MAG: hypothetical protein ABI454_08885 [Sphingomicrobium sp.]
MAADESLLSSGAPDDRVSFDYIKGKDFRVVRADGAIGGITPNGYVHFVLYSERGAIPRRQVFALTPEGTVGEIIDAETVTRGSIVREMDVDVFLRPDVAKALHTWLGEQIQVIDALKALGEGKGGVRANN